MTYTTLNITLLTRKHDDSGVASCNRFNAELQKTSHSVFITNSSGRPMDLLKAKSYPEPKKTTACGVSEPPKQWFLISQQQTLPGGNETAYPMAPTMKRGFQNLRSSYCQLCFLLFMSFYTDKIHSFQAEAPNKSMDVLLEL